MKPKFRAYIKDLDIMLYDVDVYANGMIGMSHNDLQIELTVEYGVDADGIFRYNEKEDEYEFIMSVLTGEDYIWFEEGQYELMMMTNITGEDDFEGDILEGPVYDGINNINRRSIVTKFVVKPYLSSGIMSGFLIQNLKLDAVFRFPPEGNELNIIGNIFQNKDLLE